MKKVTHICTGCGKREKHDPGKRVYCNCNPGAKFVMMVESDCKLANQMVKSFLTVK